MWLPAGLRDWLIQEDQGQKTQEPYQLFVEYAYQDLFYATAGFRPESKLGSGSAGSVYRGALRGGTEIAVKVLPDSGELSGFDEEVRMLSRLRHPNLVTLLGHARHGMERYLVYELLSGGDANKRLESVRTGRASFPWQDRLQIALDAANGLFHMVNSTPKAFHRDIKPGNILLDRCGTAKMADFGLAGTLKDAGKQLWTVENISGTPGYACPFYIQTGRVGELSEVYSFGTVMLELLLNRPPALAGPTGEITYPLLQTVQPAARGAKDRALQHLDTTASWPRPLVDSVVDLALCCVDMTPERRPLFEHIVKELRRLCTVSLPSRSLQASAGIKSPGSGYGQFATLQAVPVERPARQGLRISEVVLSCTSAKGMDLSTLTLAQSCFVIKVDSEAQHWRKTVGRQHQTDFFERFVSKESLPFISRSHFELSVESGRGPVFLKKLSANPLLLDDRPLEQGDTAKVNDGACLSLGAASDTEPHPVTLCLRVRGVPAVLECAKACGKDVQSCSAEARILVLPWDQAVEVGRAHQATFFESMLHAEPSWLAYVSRTHLRVTLLQGPLPRADHSEEAARLDTADHWLQVENLSANLVRLDGQDVLKGMTGVLLEGGCLSFVAKPAGAAKDTAFLELTLRSRGHE